MRHINSDTIKRLITSKTQEVIDHYDAQRKKEKDSQLDNCRVLVLREIRRLRTSLCKGVDAMKDKR